MAPDAAAATAPTTPALQPVDKADLDAVRGFLPGKLLGRMAALLALGILFLAQMGAFDLALCNVLGVDLSHDPPLRFGVLGALPAAVVVAQLLVEWRAQAQARRIRTRTVAVAEAKERDFRIGPYEAADREAFRRTDDVHPSAMRRQPLGLRALSGFRGSWRRSRRPQGAQPDSRRVPGRPAPRAPGRPAPRAALRRSRRPQGARTILVARQAGQQEARYRAAGGDGEATGGEERSVPYGARVQVRTRGSSSRRVV